MFKPSAKLPTTRQISGAKGETLALDFLRRAGLRHVASNVRSRGGELDLVMLDPAKAGATLVFVEVRLRAGGGYGGAAASVGAFKQSRLITAAERYLQEHYANRPPRCRFDVVTVDGEGKAEWLQDAFRKS